MSEISKDVKNIEKDVAKVLQNREDDYDYARDVLYVASEKLQDILDSAVQLAQESEHPRAIEVATQAANALADTAGKMMDHHIRTEKINNPKGEQVSKTTNNLNVKLNTKDLLELMGKE